MPVLCKAPAKAGFASSDVIVPPEPQGVHLAGRSQASGLTPNACATRSWIHPAPLIARAFMPVRRSDGRGICRSSRPREPPHLPLPPPIPSLRHQLPRQDQASADRGLVALPAGEARPLQVGVAEV